MRRTKLLVQLLLCCLILTSLSSGSLAVYTTRVELDAPVSVTAKRFYIGVNSAGSFDISLAPGEESYNEFTVTNVDAKNMPTEVNMSLRISADFSDLYREIPGIQVTLTEIGNPLLRVTVGESGQLDYYESIGFHANEGESRDFRLIFSWTDSVEDQSLFAGKHAGGIALYITGTQAL